MQISVRHLSLHDGEDHPRHGVVEVTLNRPYEGMVTVSPLRGCAPESWLLLHILAAAKVIDMRYQDDAYRVWVEVGWRYGEHECKRLGLTERRGKSGAYWAHYWQLNPDGSRHHAVAGIHVSSKGRLNQEIWGYADLLITGVEMVCPHPDDYPVDVRVLNPLTEIYHPPPLWEYAFPIGGKWRRPEPPQPSSDFLKALMEGEPMKGETGDNTGAR